MANNTTSKSQAPLSDVLEAIHREAGVHTDKESQELFLQKLLVPKYIPNSSERYVKEEVAKYRVALRGKVKPHTHRIRSGEEHRGRRSALWHQRAVHPGAPEVREASFFAKTWLRLFDASFRQSEADESPASSKSVAPRPSPLTPTRGTSTQTSSVDVRSSTSGESKRKADDDGNETHGFHKQQKTGAGSSLVLKPIPPLRLKNPRASTNPKTNTSPATAPNAETPSVATKNTVTISSGAPNQEPSIFTAPRSEARSIATPAAQKLQSPTETDEFPSAPTAMVDQDQRSIADHLCPSSPQAGPDQIRDWKVRSNVLNKDPIFPPTSQPHRDEPEIFPYGDQGWLSALWKPMKRNLLNAMWSFFNEHSIDDKAPSEFVSNPSPELRELYEVLVGGEGQWEAWLVDQKMKGVECLRQDFTLVGLFGAFVFESVFQGDLPWNAQKDLPSRTGDDIKYFEAAMRDIGHDSKNFLRNVAAKQYEDQEFRKESMAEHAKQQANALLLTLRPHLQRLTISPNPKAMNYLKCVKFLEDALTQAIQVKHILQPSKLGPFDFQWPDAGVLIDVDDHEPWFGIPGATHTLHTVLPAVRRVMADKIVVFSKVRH